MLLCDQKTFYVGITNAPSGRLKEHKNRKSFFTKKFSDFQFIYCEKYANKNLAAMREKQIKGWSRAKKQMLIDGKLGYNACIGIAKLLVGKTCPELAEGSLPGEPVRIWQGFGSRLAEFILTKEGLGDQIIRNFARSMEVEPP